MMTKYLTVDELCDMYSFKKSYIYYLTHTKQIPVVRFNRLLRFDADEIIAWAAKNGRESGGANVGEWRKYRKSGTTEMRPYVPGEDLSGISVSDQDIPAEGDMIARNSNNHDDKWLVARNYFEENYEEA